MNREFIAFLKQYGVIGLAIAVIIGGKANAFVSALVDGILMPIVSFFIPVVPGGPQHSTSAPCISSSGPYSGPQWTFSLWRGSSSGSRRRC
jgi:large-conductance mechanosensitive channel MscL